MSNAGWKEQQQKAIGKWPKIDGPEYLGDKDLAVLQIEILQKILSQLELMNDHLNSLRNEVLEARGKGHF